MIKRLILAIVSALLLFFSFLNNTWQIAPPQWYAQWQAGSESRIIGRLVKSRRDGVFSHGALMGYVGPDHTPLAYHDRPHNFQYDAYRRNLPFASFNPYESQNGAQGLVYSLLDPWLPASPTLKLRLFQGGNALLLALVLTAVIMWFHREFGFLSYLGVLVSILLSQWLIVYGRNLFWSTWAFFIPLVMVLYYIDGRRPSASIPAVKLGGVVFTAVFIKCLANGFEFMTTTLVMLATPIIYFAIRDRWSPAPFLKTGTAAVLGSTVAVILSLAILCLQIGMVKGSPRKGVDHILYALEKRTHSSSDKFSPLIIAAQKAATVDVIHAYLNGSFVDLNHWKSRWPSSEPRPDLNIRYIYLLFFLVITSLILYYRTENSPYLNPIQKRPYRGLIVATWFSLLAPLSWFIVFKAHSFVHLHLNFIVWQMPFTLMGAAVSGLVFERRLEPVR